MLEKKLETQVRDTIAADPAALLSDETLIAKFPGELIIDIRSTINKAYATNPPPEGVSLYVAYNNIVYHILRGLKPINAVKAARVDSHDAKTLLTILTDQLVAQRAEHGRVSVRTSAIHDALQQYFES